MLYGNFGTFYNLGAQATFGCAIAAVGDMDGDDIGDIVVGALDISDNGAHTGAVFLINLAPLDDSSGWCYHHTSTVTRLSSDGEGTAQVPLKDLEEGDRILALDDHGKRIFPMVESLPHGPAASRRAFRAHCDGGQRET